MKKIVTLVLIIFTAQSFGYYMRARGLQYTSESWSNFATTGFSVECESFYGFTRHTVECSYKLEKNYYNNHVPSSQPFEITWIVDLPEDAVVTEAYFKQANEWISAAPENVLDAEEAYDETNFNQPRFLFREMVSRYYNGAEIKDHQMNFGPVYYPNTFTVKFTFITKNKIDIHAMREYIYLNQFLINRRQSNINFTVNFLDTEFPDNKPNIVSGKGSTMNFTKSNGWWRFSQPFNNSTWYQDIQLKWDRPFSDTPQVRLVSTENDNIYHYMMLPPVTPADRLPKRILLLYDLGSNIAYGHNRSDLIDKYKKIAKLTIAASDSINMIYIDGFAPATLHESFVPATQANIDQVFNTLKSMTSVQISGLPQLLRASKDYINASGMGGELWLLSNADKHCNPPATANEIMQLSYYQLDYPLRHNIFDCQQSYGPYLNINGQAYYGNEYLYQNLARLSSGGMLTAHKIQELDLELEIAEVFAPAADIVKVDLLPSGGYAFTKYDLNDGKTHYPITYPIVEMGRYEGDLPMEAVFYGQVDGETLRKSMNIDNTIESEQNKYLSQIYYARYLIDLLQQPQSFATIEKIANLSKEHHILTPYCGFVVPAPSGYKGFKRLVEIDTTGYETEGQPEENPVEIPDEFAMQAFPNPFNARVTVQFDLPPATVNREMNIRIIDVLGRIVRDFKYDLPKEEHQLNIHWDGTNNQGLPVSTGLYLVQCVMGDINETVKITYLK